MAAVRLRFLGSGDAFASGGRLQTCFHLEGGREPMLIDCGATALVALKRERIDPASIGCVVLSHLHGDHFAGLPWLILDGQFGDRTRPLLIGGAAGHPRALQAGLRRALPRRRLGRARVRGPDRRARRASAVRARAGRGDAFRGGARKRRAVLRAAR